MRTLSAIVACLFVATCAAASGETISSNLPVATSPPQRSSISLGSAESGHEQWETFFGQDAVRNVTAAALYPVLPPAGASNGRAVIIVPGGAYRFVSMDSEGFRVADRLAAAGYTAFVLKYRTLATPIDATAYMAELQPVFANLGQRDLEDLPAAVTDLNAAIELVRSRAGEWSVEPGAINVIGFSAGARTLIRYIEQSQNAEALQSVALIYPPMRNPIAPGPRRPLFLAIAADDPLFRAGGLGLAEGYLRDGGSLEFHLYSGGGHGFGMIPHQTTSDHWIDQYQTWLGVQAR